MNWLHTLTQPYYFYRPTQIGRRLRYAWKKDHRHSWITLPWGYRLWVNAGDDLGRTLHTAGINDLMVSESIFRLLNSGGKAVDVGANFGYTTSLMAARLHPGGKVWAFEPHPQLFQELSRHVADWQTHGRVSEGEVQLVNAAVSDESGTAVLLEPADFQSNRGLSHLQPSDASSPPADNTREYQTNLVTLDEVLAEAGEINVLKVDVEGHEEAVFKGAQELLTRGRIHHIVYEEFQPYPAPTHRLLEQYGYHIFVVEERLLRPCLIAAGETARLSRYAPPNYLATRNPKDLQACFKPWGWRCLRTANQAI